MGLEFRGSWYHRRTWWTKRTVKDGEAMVLWSLGGKARLIEGPKRVGTWFSTINFLDRKTAGPFEYLLIERRNGSIEHLRGPVSLWVNPVEHADVSIQNATHLTSPSEAIVVYVTAIGEHATMTTNDKIGDEKASQEKEVKRLKRVVVRGPTVFCPAFGERIHEFSWTKTSLKSDNSADDSDDDLNRLKFETIKLGAPIQLILTPKLASNDGGSIEVSLLTSVVIEDIEKVLDGCDDLPAELLMALSADMLVMGHNLSSEDLRNVRGLSDQLNGGTDSASVEKTLVRLTKRCSELGVKLRSVELRDYKNPSDELAARWRAVDRDATAIQNAQEAHHLSEVKRVEEAAKAEMDAAAAESRHKEEMIREKHLAELDELQSKRQMTLALRDHEERVGAAKRELELDSLRADNAMAKLKADLERCKVESESAEKMRKAEHDELVRFLAELKSKAGVDTKDILNLQAGLSQTASGKPLQPILGSLDGLIQAALKPAAKTQAEPRSEKSSLW